MYSASAAAGTTVRLEDSGGRELLCEEIPYGFSSVVLSAPGLSVGDVCTLTVGDAQEQITIDNVSSSGFMAAGMFGGGMRGGRGFEGTTGGQDFSDRQDLDPPSSRKGSFPQAVRRTYPTVPLLGSAGSSTKARGPLTARSRLTAEIHRIGRSSRRRVGSPSLPAWSRAKEAASPSKSRIGGSRMRRAGLHHSSFRLRRLLC